MSVELDFCEYSSDAAAQAAYVSSDTTADPIIDQQQTTEGGLYGIHGEATDYTDANATSFIASGAISCPRIDVLFNKTGTPTDNIILRLETDSGGSPSGTLVDANATKSIAMTTFANGAWVEFVFPASVSLSASTTYWIKLGRSGSIDTDNFCGMAGPWGSAPYANGEFKWRQYGGSWTVAGAGGSDGAFKVYKEGTTPHLQSYSEATIKQQGSYSLKAIAQATESLNDTLTRTVSPTIDLTGQTQIKYGIYGGRTGSNIKIGIHDSGGTTTEHTANISSADTWETQTWDISGVSDANKDAIDQIIVTVVNADAVNTFYIDNMYAEIPGAVTFIPRIIII